MINLTLKKLNKKSLMKGIGSNTNINGLSISTDINGHINGPENLSVPNMYFIEALIMIVFLKIQRLTTIL